MKNELTKAQETRIANLIARSDYGEKEKRQHARHIYAVITGDRNANWLDYLLNLAGNRFGRMPDNSVRQAAIYGLWQNKRAPVSLKSSDEKWMTAIREYATREVPDIAAPIFAQIDKNKAYRLGLDFARAYRGTEALTQWRQWTRKPHLIKYYDGKYLVQNAETGDMWRLNAGRAPISKHAREFAQAVIDAFGGRLADFIATYPFTFD
jgi:hypothetical protein|nr:MAG TPA: hypothetical protein [Caudoviricetes sp.]